jgi:hypothetical protein
VGCLHDNGQRHDQWCRSPDGHGLEPGGIGHGDRDNHPRKLPAGQCSRHRCRLDPDAHADIGTRTGSVADSDDHANTYADTLASVDSQ